ncbi:RNA-binding protein 42-like [Portunus trituberculatus]|uniref:RNA-binding protein 42-like n=1 Tax=Portunus trituberculatus TaxID=210409 RepID=UPI001E1CFDE7|nr:RNA-binding protein 42-like [Portunus trituberculatus]
MHTLALLCVSQAVTVVVRNLPAGTREDQLRVMCEGLGEVVDVDIPARTARFDKFIYGFVRFADLETAHIAVRELHGKTVGTRNISAKIARSHWRNSNEDTSKSKILPLLFPF